MLVSVSSKRNADPETQSTSDIALSASDLRLDSYFVPACLANPADVYHSDVHEYHETNAFIQGCVEMVWRPGSTQKWRFKLSSQPDAFSTEVTLTGACVDGFGLIDLRINDVVQISLKESIVSRKGGSGVRKMLVLQYNSGVLIRWTTCHRRDGDGKTVDVWPGFAPKRHEGNDATSQSDQQSSVIADANSSVTPPPIIAAAGIANPQAPEQSLASASHREAPSKDPSSSKSSETSALGTSANDHGSTSEFHLAAPPISHMSRSSVPAPSEVVNVDISNTNEASGMVWPRNVQVSADPSKSMSVGEPAHPKLEQARKKLSRKKRRGLKDMEKQRKKSAQSDSRLPISTTASPQQSSTSNVLLELSTSSTPPQKTVVTLAQPDFVTKEDDQIDLTQYNKITNTITRDEFFPINKLLPGKMKWNLLGIVKSITAVSLVNGRSGPQRKRTLHVSDPTGKITINCFTSVDDAWLPNCAPGACILLKGLAVPVSDYNQSGPPQGVGYSDRLQWAIYDSLSESFSCTIPPGTPKEAQFEQTMHTPFLSNDGVQYKADKLLIKRCRGLLTWWQNTNNPTTSVEPVDRGTVISLGGIQPVEVPASVTIPSANIYRRQHRLLSDVNPEVPPRGFFNGTFEIVDTYQQSDMVRSVFVVDYTKPVNVYPAERSGMHPSLKEYLWRIEMWYPAYDVAATMSAGEFWYLDNLRVKTGQNGYFEGTSSESQKFRQLRIEDRGTNSELDALLTRREAHHNRFHISDIWINDWPNLLLKDWKDETFFNIPAAEILEVHEDTASMTYIVVTDWTSNPRFEFDNKYKFKITLTDGQELKTEGIERGCFYNIEKVNMRHITGSPGLVRGRLGGNERLITKLRTGEGASKELTALSRRKMEWQKRKRSYETSKIPKVVMVETKTAEHDTISDILQHASPTHKFHLRAHVTSAYPHNITDALVYRCTACNERIDTRYERCSGCKEDDINHECVWSFNILFELEDEHGDRLIVTLNDPDTCSVLKGLKPVEPTQLLLENLHNKLKPIIGGELSDLRRGNGPELLLDVEKWQTDRQDCIYALEHCEIVI